MKPALFLTSAALAAALAWPSAAQAVGNTLDVQVIDRDSGDTLAVYPWRGQHYVAGRPGTRYAIRVTNRTGERVLAVMSVDGVNILSGQTADWRQGGFVLAPWQSYDIAGWRKSDQEVAAFEFTALPDSYAARTGRPDDVGVIGVAVFQERVWRPAPPPAVEPSSSIGEQRASRRADASRSAPGDNAPKGTAAEKATPGAVASAGVAQPAAPAPAERLGTGHGARESAPVTSTHFARRTPSPLEVVSIQYDRYENLARAGVIPAYGLADPAPRPFPKATRGYVPDPPAR